MKKRKVDASVERQIVTGMIVSTQFLRQVSQIYHADLMEVPFTKTVATWCLDYYKQYEKAPVHDIEDIFNSWARKGEQEDQAELIGQFLGSLSAEYERGEKFNVDYALDKAEQKFKVRSLKNLTEDIAAHLSRDEVQDAELLIANFRKVQRIKSVNSNPFTDEELIYKLFSSDPDEEKQNQLFNLPGALGQMLNSQFVREGFIGIMAPEKRGKTFWSVELAIRAALARCNVAFFGIGDMSREQIMTRFFIYLAGRSDRKRYCGKLSIPVLDCKKNQENTCNMAIRTCHRSKGQKGYKPCDLCSRGHLPNFKGVVGHRTRPACSILTAPEADRHGAKFMKRLKGRDFKVESYPSLSVNVAELDNQLEIWEQTEGFAADVVIIDYADNLGPVDSKKEHRQQQNETWQRARAISQARRNLLIMGTQSDAASYDKKTMGKQHFSEDKRKYGHVTCMISLNQTDAEKEAGLMRVGQLVVREDDYNANRPVTVLQCLQIGRPHLGSFL